MGIGVLATGGLVFNSLLWQKSPVLFKANHVGSVPQSLMGVILLHPWRLNPRATALK